MGLERTGGVLLTFGWAGGERTTKTVWIGAVAAALSAAAGLGLAALPLVTAEAATGVALFAGLLAITHVVLKAPAGARIGAVSRSGAARIPWARASTESRLLTGSRGLYYLGAGTIGLLTVRPALVFTVSDWLFLLALGMTTLTLVRGRRVVGIGLPPLVLAGVGLFSIGGLVSSFGAASPLGSAAVVVRVLYLTIPWFWLGTVLLRTEAQVQRAITAWVISAALSAAGAVAQLFFGNVIPGGSYDGARATGFTAQSNDLGGLTAIAFVPALMLAIRSRGRARLLTIPVVVLIAGGTLLSGSVGALLTIVIATSVWLVSAGRVRQTISLLALLIISGVILLGVKGGTSSISPFHRVTLVTKADEPQAQGATLYSRIDVYRAAWAHIRSEPIVGVGLDAASSTNRLGLQVHNVVLAPWYTAGILGFLGIWILIGSLARVTLRVIRSACSSDEQRVAVSLAAGFLAFIVFAMSEPVLYVRYGWAPVAFLLAMRAQQRRRALVEA